MSYQSTATPIVALSTSTILPTIDEPASCRMDASAEHLQRRQDRHGEDRSDMQSPPCAGAPPVVSPAPTPTPPAAPVVTIPVPPTSKTCAKPSFLRTGRTEALGETCMRARLVVTTAWRKCEARERSIIEIVPRDDHENPAQDLLRVGGARWVPRTKAGLRQRDLSALTAMWASQMSDIVRGRNDPGWLLTVRVLPRIPDRIRTD